MTRDAFEKDDLGALNVINTVKLEYTNSEYFNTAIDHYFLSEGYLVCGALRFTSTSIEFTSESIDTGSVSLLSNGSVDIQSIYAIPDTDNGEEAVLVTINFEIDFEEELSDDPPVFNNPYRAEFMFGHCTSSWTFNDAEGYFGG